MSGPVYDHADASRTDPDTGPVQVWHVSGPHGGRLRYVGPDEPDTDPRDSRALRDSDVPGDSMREGVRALDLPPSTVQAVGVCPECGELGYAGCSGTLKNGRESRLCGPEFGKVAVRHAERVGRSDAGPRRTCHVPVEEWDREGGD